MNHAGGQRRSRAYSSADGQGLYFDASACSTETLIGFKNTRDLLGKPRCQFLLCCTRSSDVEFDALPVATEQRPPVLNCFGLHEWAMLYDKAPARRCDSCGSNSAEEGRAAAVAGAPEAGLPRHQRLPLRVSQATLNALVESRAPLKCTHFDAFRFFAAGAAPLNELPGLSRATQASNEQPGCVHASMDLFKFAMKLVPWVDSVLVGDILELAVAARTLDMRASPYDLTVRRLRYLSLFTSRVLGQRAWPSTLKEYTVFFWGVGA